MFEFRWLDRKIVRDPKISFYHGPDREIVLQYRVGSYPYQAPYENEWAGGAWTDIPTVREEDATDA